MRRTTAILALAALCCIVALALLARVRRGGKSFTYRYRYNVLA
jgi:preprotein translocase subunit SecG